MTVVNDCGNIMNFEGEDDSPVERREQRRRRIEMRRWTAISAAAGSYSQEAVENLRKNRPESSEQTKLYDQTIGMNDTGEDNDGLVPEFGTMSVAGRQREMEDTIYVQTNLCRPELNQLQPVHFFGVYDGHGGSHVSALCKDKMHALMKEELMRVVCTIENESGGTSSSNKLKQEERSQVDENGWKRAMKRCFERMDEVALNTCACGKLGDQCGCHAVEVALGGSTAVVAIVTAKHIVVANCGDSRAVLYSAGRTIPLSVDHKPDREDELARIEASGGRVIFLNGARVEGILAMSRAIGDKYLKPIVTSEPEISITKRAPEDECLILASDGLWDVTSSDMACSVVSECLRERNQEAATRKLNAMTGIEGQGGRNLYPSPSVSAAALLTLLALGRKSADNVSVIVVDLKKS